MSRKGFTLIELLVVISIISLLASVVLASLNSARDKGRLAAGKQFEANAYHAEADQAVGIWDLDECAGTSFADRSGNNNVGSFIGSPAWVSDTPSGTGCSLSIVSAQGLSVADNDMLDIGTGSITRMFWFKTTSPTEGLFRKSDSSNYGGMEMYLSSGKLNCHINDTPTVTITSSDSYNDGVWHNFACILDRSSNVMSIYVDGSIQGKADASALSAINMNASAAVLFPSGYVNFNGKIDGIRFFNKALTASEAGRLYAEEASNGRFAKK